jgi:hypothetical protein
VKLEGNRLSTENEASDINSKNSSSIFLFLKETQRHFNEGTVHNVQIAA